MIVARYFIVVILSYFIGNISFAKILSFIKKDDITKHGSGNPGTMNMLRTFGFKMGILTLLLDALKGASAALIGFYLFGGPDAGITAYMGLYIGGLSVILGHNFPVIFKFKGGKGVACILGVFSVANPVLSAIAFGSAFVYLFIFDYGAIASFIFITVLTVEQAMHFEGNIVITFLLFTIFFLTWFMHRKNIQRMLVGKENKVNLKKSIKKLYTRKERKAQIKTEKKKEIG